MDAAKHDHVRCRLRRSVAQPERIADEVRHFLDFFDLVIVREDDGVP